METNLAIQSSMFNPYCSYPGAYAVPGDRNFARLAALATALLLTAIPAIAAQPYRAPRAPDGHPDLQGVWLGSSLTPFERPDDIKTLVISNAEATRIVAAYLKHTEDRSKPTEPSESLDHRQLEPIRGQLRSSIVVSPDDGRIPSNDVHKERVRAYRMSDKLGFDGPEQRPLDERCLVGTAVPPLRATSANNLHQIIQTADVVIIHSEEFHDARIIRLNSTHRPPAIESWLGDSIGRWDGETLVVESKYFLASRFVSPQSTVVERFTRISANEIDYSFSVEDPSLYTRSWRGESHLLRSDERIYESACHEGNYSLINILQGARVREQADETAQPNQQRP
jgi:hypothetical protein